VGCGAGAGVFGALLGDDVGVPVAGPVVAGVVPGAAGSPAELEGLGVVLPADRVEGVDFVVELLGGVVIGEPLDGVPVEVVGVEVVGSAVVVADVPVDPEVVDGGLVELAADVWLVCVDVVVVADVPAVGVGGGVVTVSVVVTPVDVEVEVWVASVVCASLDEVSASASVLAAVLVPVSPVPSSASAIEVPPTTRAALIASTRIGRMTDRSRERAVTDMRLRLPRGRSGSSRARPSVHLQPPVARARPPVHPEYSGCRPRLMGQSAERNSYGRSIRGVHPIDDRRVTTMRDQNG